jgi:hypothetical protein
MSNRDVSDIVSFPPSSGPVKPGNLVACYYEYHYVSVK